MLSTALLLAAAFQQQPAGDWRPLADLPQATIRWNAAGVRRVNGHVFVPILIRRTEQPAGENAYAISEMEMDCAGLRARVVGTVNYDSQHRPGVADVSNAELLPIPDDTPFATLYARVCPAA